MSQSNRLVAYEQFPSPEDRNVFNFPALPFQIREQIWELILSQSRVVIILPHADTNRRKSTTGPPAIISVCQESRDYALKRFVNIFPGSSNPVYVNPQADMVLLSNYASHTWWVGGFGGLDLSGVRALAILQEDLGLHPANDDAKMIGEPDAVASLAGPAPAPEWDILSKDIIKFFQRTLILCSGSESVKDLGVLVMPPNTKKWAPTELELEIQQQLGPEVLPEELPLLARLEDLGKGRAAGVSESPTLPRYAVTAKPTRASAADHGESPALEDGLGFQHCWKEEEVPDDFEIAWLGVRLYRAPGSSGGGRRMIVDRCVVEL
ncbi:unnamed protein product [Clonostachys solani]|uniref:2EXR domain-containing protein n=1 Tax=Clonostachys solani TaxID=160281 RepID=A0A9P0ER90_9HYPO|nr:unnamed protein product [Clonostachys solani]